MPPEKITYQTEQSDLAGKVDKVEICAEIGLPDFLRTVSGCGFTNYLHINCSNPGENAHLGIYVGKIRAIFSDGWLSSLGRHGNFDGRGFRFFHPIFEDATYIAQVKTPPEAGEDPWDIERNKYQILIISKYYAKEVKEMLQKAGIDTSLLRFVRGRLV